MYRSTRSNNTWFCFERESIDGSRVKIVILIDPFKLSAMVKFIPPVTHVKAHSLARQMRFIITDPLWVSIVKDKLRKSL